MNTNTSTAISVGNLTYLPQFAAYLLTEQFDAFLQKQMEYAFELDIPLLKYFLSLPEDQRMAISKQTTYDFLNFLAANKASQQIERSMEQWKANLLPVINRDAIVAEDITLVNYMRKKTMVHFIPAYTTDPYKIIELVKEIDLFIIQSITTATNQYISLFKERLEEHSHFIQKVADTIPGAVYVFDVDAYKGVYSNNKLGDVIGYDHDELNALGEKAIPTLIHPDDQHLLQQQLSGKKTMTDDAHGVLKYRIKKPDGGYKWLVNYESVFKRNKDGSVSQTIGITLDIDKEQQAAEGLYNREQQLLEAQEIAQLGDYYWDFDGKSSYGSPKMLELLEVEQNDFQNFMQKVHPDDRERVRVETEKAMVTGQYNCEYRLQGKNGTKVIWARGMVDYKDGKPAGMKGTVMDITEHNELVDRLAQADKRHKQAEALTHIGTYSWNFLQDKIEWSDEMYRIYEVSKEETINYQYMLGIVHPDDRQTFEAIIKADVNKQKSYDFYYRIITSNGIEKILHSRAKVEINKEGVPEKLVGTDQDVTEKQTLIRRLRKSESIYKQAEEIAAMGNWSWDVVANKLEWTDQLYRMYGLEPQSEEITIERFLSFVHPDDRQFVRDGVEELNNKDSLDYTFRIVVEGGTVKWLRSMAQVLRNDKGEVNFIMGIEQDVTEKQKLIGKLEESQRLYKQAQELARIGNFTWNIQTGEVFWSDEVYKIYERPYGENIQFQDAFRPIKEEHKPSVQKAIEETIVNKKGQSINYAIHRKDGGLKYITLHTDVGLNNQGEISYIIGTAQDVTEKEELIERLKESERLYKQAQSLAQMGNWTYDFATNTTTWSDEMFEIYELTKRVPLTAEEWKAYLSPGDAERLFADFEKSVKEHQPLEATHTIHLPGGKTKSLHRKGEIIYGEDGRAIRIVGTTQDVTQQLKIQADLKESQRFIRKITDATPSIISLYNVDTGVYTFISEGLHKLLGYDAEEVLEKGVAFFTDIIHRDDLEHIMEKKSKALQEANSTADTKDIVTEFIYRMKHKNGEYRWFHTYGTIFDRNKEGKVEHVLNISLDITEQKEAIQTIREQEHFIQQIADASPTILYLFDIPSQSIAYINHEVFFVLGYSPDEITESNDITNLLYHQDDIELLPERRQSKRVFQQVDSMIQYECRLKHKEGGYRWVLVREIVFKTAENGAITQIIGAALDISRRKEMEKTILQNAHQLEQSNASLEEFAYVASHDLKEPLRKISTFGDRLVASQIDKLNDEGKMYLRKIVDASQRMQNMISDLLSISMISGNYTFESTSLQKVLEDTLQTLEFKIEQRKAIIRYDSLPEVKVIPSQFRQLFQNLISNSLKFVKEDAQPVIVVNCTAATEEEINNYQLAKAASYYKISFSDNGIGFENEYAQKIFAIFQRLHGRSEYEGSGIGLAICKKIVEHHGGVIFAHGQPEEGATFTIILPA